MKDRKYKKSILGKIGLILSRKVHKKLDKIIQTQKDLENPKVVELKRRKTN